MFLNGSNGSKWISMFQTMVRSPMLLKLVYKPGLCLDKSKPSQKIWLYNYNFYPTPLVAKMNSMLGHLLAKEELAGACGVPAVVVRAPSFGQKTACNDIVAAKNDILFFFFFLFFLRRLLFS